MSSLPDFRWLQAVRVAGFMAVAAAGLNQSLPASAQDGAVTRKFGVGSGPNSVGRAQSGEGMEYDGPQAIYAGKNGEIYLLDQANGRVVSFDGKDNTSPTRSLTLPNGIEPTDMIATNSGIIVWSGKPIALEAKGQGLTRSLTLSRDASAASDETVLSMFGQTGSQDVGRADSAKASATRSAKGNSEPLPNSPIRKSVATHGAGPVNAVFTPDTARTGMEIAISSRSTQAKLASLRLRTRDQLGAVELLEIDTLGRLYVLVETIPSGTDANAQTFIARFAQNSSFEGTYELPLKPDVALARRFVTVSPDGEVYFLRTRKGVVDVIGVGFAPMPKAKVMDKAGGSSKSKAKPQPELTQPPGKQTDAGPMVTVGRTAIAAVGPLTRQRVVETAFGFEGIRWRITAATYGGDPDTHCSGFDRIRRPGYLRGQLGGEAHGVPYCWGCSGSLAQFASRVERGALAGNVCTRDDPRRDVIGVDCSSFVSATWGLSTHFTTAMISSIAVEVDPWGMKPGDALNKPNSHVMLFLGYTADRKVQVIEASPGSCNGRVCRNVYPLGSLLARGYVPRRFRGLEGDMSGAQIVMGAPPPQMSSPRQGGGQHKASAGGRLAALEMSGGQRLGATDDAGRPINGKGRREAARPAPAAKPDTSVLWTRRIFEDLR